VLDKNRILFLVIVNPEMAFFSCMFSLAAFNIIKVHAVRYV
jgi:hypothetical protein